MACGAEVPTAQLELRGASSCVDMAWGGHAGRNDTWSNTLDESPGRPRALDRAWKDELLGQGEGGELRSEDRGYSMLDPGSLIRAEKSAP